MPGGRKETFSESPIRTADLTSRASIHRVMGTPSGHRGEPPLTRTPSRHHLQCAVTTAAEEQDFRPQMSLLGQGHSGHQPGHSTMATQAAQQLVA